MMIRRADPEPWVSASGRINNEVGKGLVEWSNGLVYVVRENEEGLD